MTASRTGVWLIAGFGVFLIGAGFWIVGEFERPLPEMLRAVDARRSRWIWIHSWMIAGTLVSVLAVAFLAEQLRDNGGGFLATTGQLAFAAGCLVWLIALAIRLTLTPGAAAEMVRTDAVPTAYEVRHRLAYALYAGHMLLSYASFAILGGAMLVSRSLAPTWIGVAGVCLGAACAGGFILMRGGPFSPPIIAHSFGFLVGIVLLID